MSVSKEPLNIRNNNPGNLRFVGQEGASQGEGGFAKFETPQAGLDAMRNQIELDTQKRGLNLTQFLNKYAPPSENKTTNYIDFVARKTGLDPSAPVPASAIPQLQAAMIEMEGGPRSMSYFMKTAQAPRTTAQPAARPQFKVASLGNLPTNYRLALATSYLGDTEEDPITDKAMKLLEELQSDNEAGGAGAFQKKLVAILSPKEARGGADPFKVLEQVQGQEKPAEPQSKRAVPRMPKMFAEGGEVDYNQMMVGTLLPPPEEPVAPVIRPGVSVPTMSEVPRVDAQGRVIREAPTPDQVYTPLQRVVGGAEALGTVASGLTAPASILYDVARGVPAKEISPGRFMYEPRTEAGQEYTQNLGRLAQDLKLDVALPQVQLQRPYPVGAMARQAADIATGPIDRAKIRAAASRVPEDVAYDPLRERLESQGVLSLAVKPGKEIDYSLLRPGENTPFVGELERIVADLPGPVRLQEFVNRVNKTARGYEKDRLNEFVERIKNTSSQPIDQIKLTPQQILDGLKETSPKRFLSKIIEPTEENQIGLWPAQDNPLRGNKVGTINLNLEVAPQINALSKQLDELNIAANQLQKVRSWSYVSDGSDSQLLEWKRATDQIKSALDEVSDFDPPYVNRINESIKYADEIIKFAPKFSKARHDLIYPILSDEYRAWRSSKNFSYKEADKVKDKIKDKALENLRLLFEEAERREFISPTSDPLFITFPTFYKMIKSFDQKTKSMGASTPENLEKVRKSLVEISNGYVTQVEKSKHAMLMSLHNQLDNFAYDVKNANVNKFIYPGEHTSIEQNNPISFSRFVDLTPEQITSFNIPLKDNNRGAMLVMELQSDRFDANRPTIVKKDPRTGQVTSEGPNPAYKKDVEEAYPGMGKSGQVIQQLMIKNAIHGAMKRGKGLLLFPGTDSDKAHLYEKLGPNLKQVIKDLGPGFEIKQFTFPGRLGENATRFGVYIDEDAAKRVMTQGMRFSKGGMVDKPLYDRAV